MDGPQIRALAAQESLEQRKDLLFFLKKRFNIEPLLQIIPK